MLHLQRAVVAFLDALEGVLGPLIEFAVFRALSRFQKAAAQHRRQRDRHNAGNDTMARMIVTANSCSSRPTMPPMKTMGMKTAASDTVIERMVKPISAEPFTAAS